jgi:hypothetical protein
MYSTNIVTTLSLQYGEEYPNYAERLGSEVERITTASLVTDEMLARLAYIAVKAPAEMDSKYSGQRNPTRMMKDFLARLDTERKEMFRESALGFDSKKYDRVKYLLGEV